MTLTPLAPARTMKTELNFLRRAWWVIVGNTLERHPALGILSLVLALGTPNIISQKLSDQQFRPAMVPRFEELQVMEGYALFRYTMIQGLLRGRSRADGIKISDAMGRETEFGIQTGFLPKELMDRPESWHGKKARFWIDPTNKAVWQVAIEDRVVISFLDRVSWVEDYIQRNNWWLLSSLVGAVFYLLLIVVSLRAASRQAAIPSVERLKGPGST